VARQVSFCWSLMTVRQYHLFRVSKIYINIRVESEAPGPDCVISATIENAHCCVYQGVPVTCQNPK